MTTERQGLLRPLLTGLGLLPAALLTAGCEGLDNSPITCDRPSQETPTIFRGGSVEHGVYMSSDWEGPLLAFDGGAYYELHHGLGEIPRVWQFYLSFERDGLVSGSIAQAAGNQAEVKAIDEESITVVNGSCVDYWMLAVVSLGDIDLP